MPEARLERTRKAYPDWIWTMPLIQRIEETLGIHLPELKVLTEEDIERLKSIPLSDVVK